jgi:hypothetical protein
MDQFNTAILVMMYLIDLFPNHLMMRAKYIAIEWDNTID